MQSDASPPDGDEEPRPRPFWMRWPAIVGLVILLLCCIGCGVELFRFLGWLSSTHPA